MGEAPGTGEAVEADRPLPVEEVPLEAVPAEEIVLEIVPEPAVPSHTPIPAPAAATATPGTPVAGPGSAWPYQAPSGYLPPGSGPFPSGYGQPVWSPQYGWYYPTPEDLAQAESARRQVVLSHWLGWGGLAILFMGPIIVAILTRGQMPRVYGIVAGLGLAMAVIGAIVGQIGRAKQNRVV